MDRWLLHGGSSDTILDALLPCSLFVRELRVWQRLSWRGTGVNRPDSDLHLR